jgi:CubicO group peptidase (beta-lactamase class C family)
MMGRSGILIGLLSLLTAAGCGASTAAEPTQLSPPLAEKIDTDVARTLHRFESPGAAVMVVRGGHAVFARAYGMRDPARKLPVRTDTCFEIGSITKQFTAAAILQLQEAGKLQIDRPLADYIPGAPHAKDVTLRQMLTMTSGLHDYLDGSGTAMERLMGSPASYREIVARIAPLPLDFPPGSKWSYSNTNYLLLGRVIETVSGETYRDYLQHHFFGPLHMADTHTTAEEGHVPGMAIGYRHANGRLEIAPRIDASWGGAAGFLVTTLADLAKWDAALRNGKVVSKAGYRQMTTSFMAKNGSANYGFGFFVDSVYGQPRIGHTGGSLAFTTADEYFPNQDTRVIAFTNQGDETPEAGEALTNVVFADLYPAVAAKALTPAAGESTNITAAVRDAFRELQTGKDYKRFSARLKGKLAGGIGSKFVTGLAPYGAPTAAIFKGIRRDTNQDWYEYVMQFGPGVSLPFAVRTDKDGAVAGISVG